jgi:hypothetical protein
MQLPEDKTKHFAHVLPASPLADDALGALQIGSVTASIAASPTQKPFKRKYLLIESALTKSNDGVADGSAEPRNDP